MNITDIFDGSLLSQAAYADNLDSGLSGSALVAALTNSEFGADMTTAQAEYFADNYRVIQQQDTTASGFSATLFQNIHTNEYHFSMRGTDEGFFGADWQDANYNNGVSGIATNQVVDMLNFYLRLTQDTNVDVPQYEFDTVILASDLPPPSQPYYEISRLMIGGEEIVEYGILNQSSTATGFDNITDSTSLNVTGHSLGGHLASVFSLLFPQVTVETSTFNSAGFVGLFGQQYDLFAQLVTEVVDIININPDALSFQSLDSVTDISAPLDIVSHLGSKKHQGQALHMTFV